jgi:hypothetical protein
MLFLLSLLPLTHQMAQSGEDVQVGFGPSVYAFTSGQTGLSVPAVYFGGTARLSLSPTVFLSAAAAVGSIDQMYDTPGGQSSLSVSTSFLEAEAGKLILGSPTCTGLSVAVAIGVTRFHHDGLNIDAGALGTISGPSATDYQSHLALNLRLEQSIAGLVHLMAGPAIKVVDPLSSNDIQYSLSGGLLVTIN